MCRSDKGKALVFQHAQPDDDDDDDE